MLNGEIHNTIKKQKQHIMKSIFKKDIDNKKMFITREFAAPLEKVWQAWTDAKVLEHWWAPKPWKAVSVNMNFNDNGHWLYYMQGPEGEQHWCKAEFDNITPMKNYDVMDYFCDEKGNPNTELPRMHWKNKFSSTGNGTLVEIEITFDKVEDLEKIIEMGFQEGFTMGHGNLDEYLANN